MATRCQPTNKTQKDRLVEFMEAHPELNTGKFSSTFTHKVARDLWEVAAKMLNAIPNGSNKNWEQWRKTWQDLKKNAKSKASKLKKHMNGTGGGPLDDDNNKSILNESDEKIMKFIPHVLVEGHKLVEESFVRFDFGDDPADTEVAIPSIFNSNEEIIMPAINEDFIDNSEDLQVVELEDHTLDHNYSISVQTTSKIEAATGQTVANDKNMDQSFSNKIQKRRRRPNKTTRLATSLNISNEMLKVQIFNAKRRSQYQDKKLEILNEKNRLLNKLLLEVINIKTKL